MGKILKLTKVDNGLRVDVQGTYNCGESYTLYADDVKYNEWVDPSLNYFGNVLTYGNGFQVWKIPPGAKVITAVGIETNDPYGAGCAKGYEVNRMSINVSGDSGTGGTGKTKGNNDIFWLLGAIALGYILFMGGKK